MSQRYASIRRQCRSCGIVLYGPWGLPEEVWRAYIELVQGKWVTFKGETFEPHHQCSHPMTLGVLEVVEIRYSYVAPFTNNMPDDEDKRPSVIDPDSEFGRSGL
jgi:hypothetical protein